MVKHIWSCGLLCVQMMLRLLYFFSAEVESVKDISFTSATVIVQRFAGNGHNGLSYYHGN